MIWGKEEVCVSLAMAQEAQKVHNMVEWNMTLVRSLMHCLILLWLDPMMVGTSSAFYSTRKGLKHTNVGPCINIASLSTYKGAGGGCNVYLTAIVVLLFH